MAKSNSVWGIDIGQCGLKALRCKAHDKDPSKVVAEVFDYIEYPKILSQPEAEPRELIRDALQLFLSRNDLSDCRVAIAVSGQSGLARFIKLPPVETSKIPDIVQYEANQQIPFDLKDVIWDYQRMYGGSEEDGFALETEVGLFAMKRHQVFQELEPYQEMAIDADVVQLTPLAIYNYVFFDLLGDLPPEEEYDPDDPPPSYVVLSIGTEVTDLVITNGYRVWQRSIPLGGSHFTKALVKELNLTYAKAEHLKRNATQADDPKTVYQAMRPVFKDILTEIQRSIGYFLSLDRSAKIGTVIALGNSMNLPGLRRYLAQHLGEEIKEVKTIRSLTGPAVTESPAFKDNVRCFGVSYGLALQALGLARLTTNLMPKEVVRDRIIVRKKPWAVAAAVLLALACVINFLILWFSWIRVQIDQENGRWRGAKTAFEKVEGDLNTFDAAYKKEQGNYQKVINDGSQLVSHFDRRLNWLALYMAISNSLPADPPGEEIDDLTQREQLWVTEMRCQHFDNLGKWFKKDVEEKFKQNKARVVRKKANPKKSPDPMANVNAVLGGDGRKKKTARKAVQNEALDRLIAKFESKGKPSGPGYVIELTGYHFHDSDRHDTGATFVRRTLCHNFQHNSVMMPGPDGVGIEVPIRDLGLTHPVVLESADAELVEIPNPAAFQDGKRRPGAPETLRLKKNKFVVQFAWNPKPFVTRKAPRIAKSQTNESTKVEN